MLYMYFNVTVGTQLYGLVWGKRVSLLNQVRRLLILLTPFGVSIIQTG